VKKPRLKPINPQPIQLCLLFFPAGAAGSFFSFFIFFFHLFRCFSPYRPPRLLLQKPIAVPGGLDAYPRVWPPFRRVRAFSVLKEANAGALTNFEVLDFLRSRGASKDPTRVIVPIAPSEFKVYDYLVESAACNQTKEHVKEFLERCKSYKLAKAEVLNIINLRPSALVEIDPVKLFFYMFLFW
ncbi:hypothetical protein Gohar_008283, partial [Gossypium harknessii]|nr:hypothetical protein [Gossypium harknessii]